jgi:hypothetical protein
MHSPREDTEEEGGYWKWAHKKLVKLVAEAKGAATNEIIKFVTKQYVTTKYMLHRDLSVESDNPKASWAPSLSSLLARLGPERRAFLPK